MRRKKHYTIIITDNSASSHRSFSVSGKLLRALLAAAAAALLLTAALLADYFGLSLDKSRLKALRAENRELKRQFLLTEGKVAELARETQQLGDFVHKARLITTASVEHGSSAYGKVTAPSDILHLSRGPASFKSMPSGPPPAGGGKTCDDGGGPPSLFGDAMGDSRTFGRELEIIVDDLREKSLLTKQKAWDLYTSLLERKELLNSTPSILPAKGWISSSFGYRNETFYADHEPQFHQGIDIAAESGTKVVAAADGKVIYTGYDERGYGNLLVIDHGYSLKTYYAHLAEITVERGVYVRRGEPVALVGNTGRSTGSHLHYEIRIAGQAVNPENYTLDDHFDAL